MDMVYHLLPSVDQEITLTFLHVDFRRWQRVVSPLLIIRSEWNGNDLGKCSSIQGPRARLGSGRLLRCPEDCQTISQPNGNSKMPAMDGRVWKRRCVGQLRRLNVAG